MISCTSRSSISSSTSSTPVPNSLELSFSTSVPEPAPPKERGIPRRELPLSNTVNIQMNVRDILQQDENSHTSRVGGGSQQPEVPQPVEPNPQAPAPQLQNRRIPSVDAFLSGCVCVCLALSGLIFWASKQS